MIPVLVVSHAGLGALALAASFLPVKWERRVLVALSVLGFGAGVTAAVYGVLGETWRSLVFGDSAVVAGAASAVAWLVAGVTAAPRSRAVACGLVGVASSALIVSSSSRWLVPMLLFWICSTLALAVLAGAGKGGTPAWSALFLSDALFLGALLANWFDTRAWEMPLALEGWPQYLVLGAAAVRGGALPVIGVWGAMRGTSAPAAPLLAGGAFVLAAIGLSDGDPWTGSALLAVAIGSGVWGLWAGGALLPASGAASMALSLGAAILAPAALVPAGLAAIISAGAIALWGRAGGLGGAEKGFALASLPPSVGFTAVAIAVGAAVEELSSAQDVIDKVPWTMALVLLPAAYAAAIVVAARSSLTLPRLEPVWPALRSLRLEALTLLASLFLVLAGLAAGMVPGEWLGIDAAYAAWSPRRTILFGGALVLGLVGAWLAGRKAASPQLTPPDPRWLSLEPRSGSITARILTGVSLALAVASIAAVAWFTFEGLRLGFL